MSQGGERARSSWSSLFDLLRPIGDESVEPEFYRISGKVRFIAVALLFLTNLLGSVRPQDAGFEPAEWNRYMWLNSPLLVLDLAATLFIWRGRLAVSTMRRLTVLCVLLESTSTLLLIHLSGSVTSHMIVFSMVLVLGYRAFFDYRVGLLAFVYILVGHWAIVAAETLGLAPPARMYLDGPSPIYDYPQGQSGSMFVITVGMLFVFVGANTLVGKLRNKEKAIRLLRAHLAAAQPGKVGRHTGRSLAGKYELGNLLGAGGMGEVYRGQHRQTKRAIAIKTLHPHLLEDDTLLKRFQREAEIMGSLGSEHIVEILDIGQTDDLPFLVLELLEGESLGERIEREGHLQPEEVTTIITQAGRGLQCAHEAGIVHRDLKPENLFLSRRGDEAVVKILDFGVSKIKGEATALTQEMALLGTPDFMSPEQALGRMEDIDQRTDIFALGAIAYTALSGTRPFTASSIPALLRRICDEEPPELDELDAELRAVLAIAMAKKPAQRYQSVSEFCADFEAACDKRLSRAVLKRAAAVERGAPSSAALSMASAMGQAATDAPLALEDTAAAGLGSDETLPAAAAGLGSDETLPAAAAGLGSDETLPATPKE